LLAILKRIASAIKVTKLVLNKSMMTSNAVRIGPVEDLILRTLDRTNAWVWRIADGPIPASVTIPQAWNALHHLAEAGLIERIERGSYLVLPRSGRVLVPPLELVGSWLRKEPYAVIGRAAAEMHRLTLDTSNLAEIQIERSKKAIEFQGVTYAFTRSRSEATRLDNVKVSAGRSSVIVASPGKTLVLLLNLTSARRSERPVRDIRLAIEMLERGRRLGTWAKTDWVRLVVRHGNSHVARRLGFLLERADIPGSESLLALRGQSAATAFSPIYPAEGPRDTRWRLILNDPLVR
jgi:predicted transcriptional regulator of viral defense system